MILLQHAFTVYMYKMYRGSHRVLQGYNIISVLLRTIYIPVVLDKPSTYVYTVNTRNHTKSIYIWIPFLVASCHITIFIIIILGQDHIQPVQLPWGSLQIGYVL